MPPNGFHYGGGVIVALGPRQIAVHAVSRRSKHLGILRPEQLELWQALLPQLTRAVKAQGRLHELAAERETQALASKHRARRVVGQNDGPLLDENGHPAAPGQRSPRRRPTAEPRPRHLQQIFHVTKSKAEVCFRLAAGLTVEETAAARFVSLNTVRTYLKRVLSKTSTRRQPQLTTLLHRVAAQQLFQ